MKKKTRTERLTVTSMLFAVGIILPFATSHGFGIPGNVLLPMHIPVFLAGLLCGPMLGCATGLLLPPVNSLLTGMPVLYPMMPIMTAELATYGLVSGLVYHKTPLRRYKLGVYVSMILAMIAGRVSYGIVFNILLIISGQLKALTVFSAIVTGIPGIVIQLLLVPGIVLTLGIVSGRARTSVVDSAKNLITEDKASCVVIKDGRIVTTEHSRGIGPIIDLYDRGLLGGATVVDKVIGKAAASVLVLGGAVACYGVTMSASAKELLLKNGIRAECTTLTEHIVNRKGDGVCPMEMTVADIDDPQEALAALREKMAELRRDGTAMEDRRKTE